MIARLQKAMKDKDQGFTLIELLVVIVIIGILAAIAIPLFLNQRQKGVDAGVKADLKALATTQETYYTDNLAYTEAAADITATGFNKTDGNDILVAVTTTGFCIRGFNAGGSADTAANAYWYDSEAGGLDTSGTMPTGGACAAAVMPVASQFPA